MPDHAIAWAQSVLDSPVVFERLEGGVTSTMLALTDASGGRSVLRLMTEEPWRTHGPALTRRERAAQLELAATAVPAPATLALDADGLRAGVSAHLMTMLPGEPAVAMTPARSSAMVQMLARIHDVRPVEPFRTYQSWAWEAKRVVPAWTEHAESWRRAFHVLAEEPPPYQSTFLHRDFSHRNLLWHGDEITGVVDWVETSTGPAWLDAGHAATNLAVAFGPEVATRFVQEYAATTGSPPEPYWLVLDTVGFLPPPGKEPMFGSARQLAALDGWLHGLVSAPGDRSVTR